MSKLFSSHVPDDSVRGPDIDLEAKDADTYQTDEAEIAEAEDIYWNRLIDMREWESDLEMARRRGGVK